MSYLLSVPFFECEGRRCAQTAMRSALAYRGIEKNFQELDRLVESNGENSVSLVQVADAFDKLDLPFFYPVRPFFKSINPEDIWQRVSSRYSKKIFRFFDKDSSAESLERVRKSEKIKLVNQRPSLRELRGFLEQDRVPICVIDYDVIADKDRRKINGHYVVLTGLNDNQVYFHDCSIQNPCPNKEVPINQFLEAWDFSFIDWDVLFV
jgi:hypothetical protein